MEESKTAMPKSKGMVLNFLLHLSSTLLTYFSLDKWDQTRNLLISIYLKGHHQNGLVGCLSERGGQALLHIPS